MSAVSRLSRWLRDSGHPELAQARMRAERWNILLDSCPKAPTVHLENPLDAFALLLACWSRGWAPLFLPDRQAATLDSRGEETIFLEAPPPQAAARPLPRRDATGSDIAVRLLTSGSTGERKEVAKTFDQIEGECSDQTIWSTDLFKDRILLTTVSHQHIYGFLFLLMRPALEGAPFPSRRDFFWEEMLPSLRRGPCVLVTSPTHLPHLLQGLERFDRADLVITSSGGAVAPAVGQVVARHATLLEVYGSTETGGVARRRWTPQGAGEWIPFPSVRWSIQEEGRLVLESPWAQIPGSHLTDDLAQVEGEGFRLCGRHDRIVKVSDKRLSLDELECWLKDGGLVSDARACVLDKERRQEIGVVVEPSRRGWDILQEQGRSSLVEHLRERLSQRFEPVLMPRHFRFSALPRNAQGKVVLDQLRARLQEPEILLDGIGAHLRPEHDGLVARFFVPDAYPRLEGHFPDYPVVPGVAQLTWAMEAVLHLEPGFRVAKAQAVKFHSILRPGVEVTLDVRRGKNGCRFEIETTADPRRKVSSGRFSP